MAALLVGNARRPRRFRRVDRQTEDMDDEELRRRYRFGTENLDRLEDLVRDRLERQTQRNRPLTVRQQLLIALRFLASGCFLQLIGDTFGVDVATVSRTVTLVVDTIFDLKNRFIHFPTSDDEKRRVKKGFFDMRGFPGVIGCVDCTHVRIISPAKEIEAGFVNRKRFHSINVQATCDYKGLITSINAVWPGSVHDSHIFRISNLGRHMETYHQDFDQGYLLGDSGYPCRPYLLTPHLNPINDQQEAYNRAQMSTRNTVERMFGLLKRRFHVLHSEVRMKPAKVSRIIVACAVLHNMAISWKEPDMPDDGLEDDEQPQLEPFEGVQDGRGVRQHITDTFF